MNDGGLVGEEIYVYTKFTYTTELNNILIGIGTSF